MSLRPALIVTIAWAYVSLAQAADQPTVGFLHNTAGGSSLTLGSSLTYDCDPARFDEITCQFTQTAGRRKADPKDLQKALQNGRSQFAPLGADECSSSEKLLNVLRTGDTAGVSNPAEASQKLKVMPAGVKQALTEIMILLLGFAETKVETNRITSIAKAEGGVLEIQLDAIERMKQRVVATELRRQHNIETITAEAIEYLNREHANDESRPIDDDWMASWLEGAKEAPASEVRSMWARLLEAQALSARNTVSGPSLALLRNLDGNLARAFSDFVCHLWAYGCCPLDRTMPLPVAAKDLAILEEVGFVTTISLPTQLNFHDFKLRGQSANLSLGFVFTHATLTHRAYELATAIYPDDAVFRDRLPDQTNKASALISFIEGSKNAKQQLLLFFRRKGPEDGEVAVRVEWSTPPSPESFSDTLRELNANAEVSQLASDVLRGLHERGARLTFVNSP